MERDRFKEVTDDDLKKLEVEQVLESVRKD
jgi:hypothetical protein